MGVSAISKPVILAAVVADDATLIRQACAGNDRAFAALYKRHARYVAGVVFRVMGSDAELDDVMQETFCDAARALGSLNDAGGLRAWLARIAVRRVRRRMARRARWHWLLGAAGKVSPTSSDPRARQRVDALYEALEKLPVKARIPWVLHRIEGESLPEAAQICDVSLATVKRRIAEADAKLEKLLS
jgi:RNA polymerase sigma-70 factor (ECF subfamily)